MSTKKKPTARKVNPASLKNLKPRKKGDKPLRGAGRPKGAKDKATLITWLLQQKLTPKALEELKKNQGLLVQTGGITLREAMWLRVAQRALSGDMAAIEKLEAAIGEGEISRHLLGSDPENPLPEGLSQDAVLRMAEAMVQRGAGKNGADK